MDTEGRAFGALNIAMVNDLHYWVVVPIGHFTFNILPDVTLDNVRSSKQKSAKRGAADEVSDDDTPPMQTVIDAPRCRSDADVNAEMAFCTCLRLGPMDGAIE